MELILKNGERIEADEFKRFLAVIKSVGPFTIRVEEYEGAFEVVFTPVGGTVDEQE